MTLASLLAEVIRMLEDSAVPYRAYLGRWVAALDLGAAWTRVVGRQGTD